MYTKEQDILLEDFADASDNLFNLGIIRTDSFTGEIGEYIACSHLKLTKTNRVSKAVDAICSIGNRYQIKAKVISNNNFNYTIRNLQIAEFEFLIVVYFDKEYDPLKILKISSSVLSKDTFIIKNITNFECETIERSEIIISSFEKSALNSFAKAYNALEKSNIIRSRRIVGDIGEFYACKRLNLVICNNKNEKGIDARDNKGLTYEIKTRRVYTSERRKSETRRLNNLIGKTSDYLIVVTLDRKFKCSGMWLIPMKNLINPKSANLKIVNSTYGVKNLIPSDISWLKTGDVFVNNENLVTDKYIKPAPLKTRQRKKGINIINENKKVSKSEFSFSKWIIIIAVIYFIFRYLI